MQSSFGARHNTKLHSLPSIRAVSSQPGDLSQLTPRINPQPLFDVLRSILLLYGFGAKHRSTKHVLQLVDGAPIVLPSGVGNE